jgi:hypothetical protein
VVVSVWGVVVVGWCIYTCEATTTKGSGVFEAITQRRNQTPTRTHTRTCCCYPPPPPPLLRLLLLLLVVVVVVVVVGPPTPSEHAHRCSPGATTGRPGIRRASHR